MFLFLLINQIVDLQGSKQEKEMISMIGFVLSVTCTLYPQVDRFQSETVSYQNIAKATIVTDFLSIIDVWGSCDGCPVDLNGDGMVNVVDLLEVIGNWG